jgi:RNA polymerase sigma-70 factor, ECF subfamily
MCTPAQEAEAEQAESEDRPPATGDDDLRQAVTVFMTERPQLVRLAHRVLGRGAAAEDVVQEAWVRWQRTDRRAVDNPAAFLATVTTRLAINVRQAAATRHETTDVQRLPDRADPASSPETTAETGEALALALRVLLERLGPAERAAFILRTGFDYPYPQVAEVLALNAPHVRQLVSRARARLRSPGRRPVGPDEHRRLVRAFVTATEAGELVELERLLATDAGRRAG